MAESLEPKQSLGPKVAAAFLWVLAIAGGGYLLLFYEAPDTTDILSPGQVRKVVAKLRDHQAERLALQVKQMRQMRAEMQKIRDKWAGEAPIDRPLDEVLEQSELEARQSAEAELAEKELIGVYDVGRAVEQDMITIYREFLAARTVGLRPGYSYEEAYEASMTPRPERPGLSQDVLYADITSTADDGGLPAFNEELRKSTIEMREMHENAKKLLAFTKKSSSSTNDGLSVDMSQDDMAMLGYIGPELLPDEIDLTHAPDVGNFAAIPGRRLTTGGDVDQWLYIDTWYIIGPFQGDRRRKNLDVRFGPEANVNLDDVFTGHNNRKIQWRTAGRPEVGVLEDRAEHGRGIRDLLRVHGDLLRRGT